MNKCKQCEYEWYGRKEKPISCPKCKRYDWNEVKVKDIHSKNDNGGTEK